MNTEVVKNISEQFLTLLQTRALVITPDMSAAESLTDNGQERFHGNAWFSKVYSRILVSLQSNQY